MFPSFKTVATCLSSSLALGNIKDCWSSLTGELVSLAKEQHPHYVICIIGYSIPSRNFLQSNVQHSFSADHCSEMLSRSFNDVVEGGWCNKQNGGLNKFDAQNKCRLAYNQELLLPSKHASAMLSRFMALPLRNPRDKLSS